MVNATTILCELEAGGAGEEHGRSAAGRLGGCAAFKRAEDPALPAWVITRPAMSGIAIAVKAILADAKATTTPGPALKKRACSTPWT